MNHLFGDAPMMNITRDLNQVVSAPLSEALLCVDSRDGIKSDKATGLYINPKNPFDIQIYNGIQMNGRVKRIKLKEINMTYNVPNVNPTNNVLFVQEEGQDETAIEILPGFYTPTELATAIQDALNAALPYVNNWACEWIPGINHFYIRGGVPRFRILPKIGQGAGTYQGTVRTDTLATMMGFNSTNLTYSYYIESSFASMLYTTYVDIVSTYMTKNQYISDKSTNARTGNSLLARLYITPDRNYSITDTNIIGTRSFMLYKEFSNPKEINWDENEPIVSINIQLLDDKGNVLYAPSAAVNSDTPFELSTFCGNSGFVQMTFGVSEAMGL
jgi:hypothetical protein